MYILLSFGNYGMALFSFDEYLLWESTEGAVSKVPVLFDQDDLLYLIGSDPNWGHFPPAIWRQALKWRYNQGLIRSIQSRNTKGKIKDIDGVLIPGSRQTPGAKGSQKGSFLFMNVTTGQNDLMQKLGGKPDRASILKHHKKGTLGQLDGPRSYGYDLSDVRVQRDDNPLHFASGMPVMQDQAATDALSGWIYGTYHKILGEWPRMFQGKPVAPQKIPGWSGYRTIKQFPAINKNFRFVWIPEDGEFQQIEYTNHPCPVLLPGKYVPIRDESYENIKTPRHGLTGSKLMRAAGNMTQDELSHFQSHSYGPEHFIARHKAVAHKRFYVIGGWSPTNVNKGETPMFTDQDDLEEFLQKRAKGGKTFSSILTSEARKGVADFISSIKFSTEGIVMKLMEDDIVDGAKQLLLRNLGDPHLGPFEYGDDDVEKVDIKVNSQRRIRRAYDYAKEISQTNISLVGGTRRQREKWAREGGSPEGDDVAPLVTGQGSRRWVKLTTGATAGRGWIGSSMRYMKREMEELEDEARDKEREADSARNVEIRIAARRDAIATVLEKLLKKYVMLQAAWHSQQGIGEDDMTINRDAALAAALTELPKELDRLGIPHSKLPKDVVAHFKPQEAWAGRTPATSNESRGVQILNDLINNGEVEVGGRKIKLQDLAQNDELYDQMLHYVNNLAEISADKREKQAMSVSLNRLIQAVDRVRMTLGMSTRSPAPKQGKSQEYQYVQSMLEPSKFFKVAIDPTAREDFIGKVKSLVAKGEVKREVAEKILASIKNFAQHDEVAGATSVVMGTKPKIPKKRTFNIEGAPGGLGNNSVEEWPIGTKEDKKKKKKKNA